MKHGGNVYEYQRNRDVNLIDIIDFSANINPLGFSEKGMTGLMEGLNEIKHYPDPDYKELKASIGQFEGVEESQIILGNGAIECIFILAEALNIKNILLMSPTFSEYERAFERNQTDCVFHDLKFDENLNYESLISYDVSGYVICNPNNPTGQIIAKDELTKLLEFCQTHDRYLIIDEAFIDFSYEESMKDHLQFDKLVILKSVTKFFAVPGLRLGYILTSNDMLINKISISRMPWSVNHLVDCYTRAALSDRTYINETKEYVRKERNFLMQALSDIKGLKVYRSNSNYIFFKSDNLELNVKLEKYDILIRDCSNYRKLDKGYFRIAVKSNEDNMYLLRCIKEIME